MKRPSSIPEARMLNDYEPSGGYECKELSPGTTVGTLTSLEEAKEELLSPNEPMEFPARTEVDDLMAEYAKHQARHDKLQKDWLNAGLASGGPYADMIWDEIQRVEKKTLTMKKKLDGFIDAGVMSFDDMMVALEKARK